MPNNRTPDTLRLPASRRPTPTRTRLRTRPVPVVAYIAILLVLPVAVVVTARATGWWVTTGHTVPATAIGAPDVPAGVGPGGGQGLGNGQGSNASGEPGTGGGPSAAIANPHDVKGSMTVQQVIDAFPQVTADEIYKLFGVPADTPTSTQLKTVAKKGNGFEVDDLREWLESKIER